MQVKVAESVPKRHVSFEERYFIEPRAIMALDRTHGSSLKPLCLCEKKCKFPLQLSMYCK